MARTTLGLLVDAARAWRRDSAPRLGAALAFYTVLSLAPLFFFTLSVAGLFLDPATVREGLAAPLDDLVGPAGVAVADTLFDNALEAYAARRGPLPPVVGVLLLLMAASAVLNELRASLDAIWHTGERASVSLLRTVLGRLVSFAVVLSFGFLLMVSLVLASGVTALSGYLSRGLGDAAWLVRGLDLLANAGAVTLVFAFLYKFIPDVRLAWRDVAPGAGLAALAFMLARWGFGLAFGHSPVATAYGAAGSLVVFLLWVFLGAQIFFYGAEVVKLYAERHGSRADLGPP